MTRLPKFVLAVSLLLPAASAAGQAPGPVPPRPDSTKSSVKLVKADPQAGLELWDTVLGQFWIPSPGRDVMAHLQWEQTEQKVYDSPDAHVKTGDVVLDCGAHIGYFTRVALRAGASLVVAVEPEVANIAAFKRNFEKELRAGTVKLVAKGVWNSTGKLSLNVSGQSNDSHTVLERTDSRKTETIEVVDIDRLARELRLSKVDFVKMDIEGAELKALQGARNSIAKWRPRLAISAYHVAGDPGNIATFVWRTRTDYRVTSKDVTLGAAGAVVPKVLFFF
jgi:FkbM family methyltransferase